MKNTITGIVLLFALQAQCQCMHDSITFEWDMAGLEIPVPDFQSLTDVTQFGAVPGDSLDDKSAVMSAINSLAGNAGVIYFPAGNYIFSSSLTLPDSIVLRGAGSDSTIFTFNFNGNVGNSINVSGGPAGNFFPVISGYQKDSRQLTVSQADSIFTAGDEIEIHEANGSWDTNPATWADFSVGHLSKIDSVTGDIIWLHEELRIDFDAALNPEIRKMAPRKLCGLECFKMIRTDGSAASVNFGVNFSFATNCWMHGVESEKSICAHVALETSSHIEISGCYFHESYLYDGASTHGYGIVLFTHACSNKIEDNIFRMLRHAMICKQGANGNVFGYNYSRETNRSEAIADYAADICLHGHYAFANLYEGNIAQNLQIDQAWGPSGPYNTFFRNKIENYGLIMSSGTVQSDRQNFVGNDISNSSLFHGLYSLTGSGHFEFGNNVRGTITPGGTNNLPDTSYYIKTFPPAFWNIPASMPSIGIPNTFSSDVNPALDRYNNGGVLTLCGYIVDTTIITHVSPAWKNELYALKVFQKENLLISEINFSIECDAVLNLYSVNGIVLLSEKINLISGLNRIALKLPADVSNGIYFVHISTAFESLSKKCFLMNSSASY